MKLAMAAAGMALGLLGIAWAATVRINHTPPQTDECRKDIAEAETAKRQSLWGAAIFAVVTVGCLIAWAL